MATALKELGRTLNEAWQSVSEGWRELLDRSSAALTRFIPRGKEANPAGSALPAFPRWGLLAGEVVDKGKSIVVQVELPGITRDDCDIVVENHALRIRGERQVDREHIGRTYYVMERAYGSFERVVPLPDEVDPDSARASMRNGVLTVELTKKASGARRRVPVK